MMCNNIQQGIKNVIKKDLFPSGSRSFRLHKHYLHVMEMHTDIAVAQEV